MGAAKKATENRKVLQELIPLNALSSERFEALLEKIVIEEVRSGRYLFRKGDRDGQTIYLLAGKINLMDGFRKVSGEVEAGTEASRHPIAGQQPRPHSARVVKKAVIARIDSSLLDAFLSWDQSSAAEVVDIGSNEDGDWMTRLLQSETFSKLPPSKLQGLLIKMKPFAVKKGDVVIAEGSEGDYFYTIHEGRCAVTRMDEATGEQVQLAELGNGDSFGEDALISDACRNATITMLTDGELMRLAKQDFIDLLQTQLVSHVTFEQAEQMVSESAIWLDVRTPDEYKQGCIEDSVNIPLVTLRNELAELVFNTKYVICCDTGSRSDSAAFLLSHRGFDVCVLEGGMQNLVLEVAAQEEPKTGSTVDVVDFSFTSDVADKAGSVSRENVAEVQQLGLQSDDDSLSGEYHESVRKLEELRAQADAHAGEKQALVEQLQSIQLELQQERSKAKALAKQVESAAGECAALNEKVAAGEQGAQSELARLQAELSRARGRVSELESAVESSNAASAEQRKQLDENAGQVRASLQVLQGELDAERNRAEDLSAELATATKERKKLLGDVASLGREMAVLQESARATSGKLAEEGGVAAALREQNDELSRQVVQLQNDLAEQQSQLESSAEKHENRQQELQQQLEQQLADSEQSRKELQSLQGELATAHNDTEHLSRELDAVTAERKNLSGEVASLGREMAVLQESARATSSKLAEEGGVAAALREQNDQLSRQVVQLQNDLAGSQSQLESSAEEYETRQQELQQQLAQLDEELAGRQSQLESSAEEHETLQQELQQQLEQLQAELAERQSQLESSAAEHETRQQELQQQLEQLQAELAGRQSQLESSAEEHETRQQELQQQLEQLQGELAERQSQLEARVMENEDQSREYRQQLEQLQTELAERESQLESNATEHETRQQELQQQLDTRATDLQQTQEQLQSVTAEHEQAQATIESLKEESRQLRSDGSDLNNKYRTERERAESLLEERNAAAAVYARQQAEWHDLRSVLKQQISTHEKAVEKLSAENEQLAAAMAEVTAEFEQKLQQQVEQFGAEQEQQARRFAELEQVATATGGELDVLKQQHAELEQVAEQSAKDKVSLEEELADKIAQLETSRMEISQHEVDKTVLGQELELSQQRVDELKQTLEKHEVQVKALEQDLQETTRKAHDDLKRKNENEKELRSQLEEHRKSLEQVSADFQKSRAEAQDTIDYLREELHSERDARDAERVEMATRQRELKEQLAVASSVQGGTVGDHPGALEDAIDAVRTEERKHLQTVVEAHEATETQLEKVQEELKQAHKELAEHHAEEKNRRQGDSELMAEQNRLAEAAIDQLQKQLTQLTHERDDALENQQDLREKMDSLRAEVEVARGLIDGTGKDHEEDPVQLRKQLDETRQNVEIAVRLRTEAEAARDRLVEERDRLLVQIENGQNAGVPVSTVDAPQQKAEAARPAEKTAAQKTPVLEAPVRDAVTTKSPGNGSRLPRWLGPVIGLLAVGVIAVVGWLLMAVELKPVEDAAVAVEETQTVAGADTGSPAATDPSEPETAQVPPAEHEQPAPIVREKAASEARPQAADEKKDVKQVSVKEKQEAQAAKEPVTEEAGPVARTFSDRLKTGGRGPAMVELAAASYQMGSVGNSMNASEVPRHEVELPVFSISRHEVSFDDYRRYASATGRRMPKDEGWGRGKRPVINVSWDDAQRYVKWLSAQTGKTYRLPTEAQWEYAARGGNDESYWWTGVHNDIPANCFDCGSEWDGARTAPVGQFAANAFGLHDMAGNAQEWTQDCYNRNYTGAPADGSAWLTSECNERVVRGGSYSSPKRSLRSAKRAGLEQDTRLDNLGFRVVRVD
jgi:formylglycine-generating enzyme required for sulfatase activity/chromosome segregation ATPase/CRP-like cAMP-binding protein